MERAGQEAPTRRSVVDPEDQLRRAGHRIAVRILEQAAEGQHLGSVSGMSPHEHAQDDAEDHPGSRHVARHLLSPDLLERKCYQEGDVMITCSTPFVNERPLRVTARERPYFAAGF